MSKVTQGYTLKEMVGHGLIRAGAERTLCIRLDPDSVEMIIQWYELGDRRPKSVTRSHLFRELMLYLGFGVFI